jgi:hypothetical protein
MSEESKSKEDQLLRHDIKNQLSNIVLSVEQLKYEIPDLSEDCAFYIETIAASCKNINDMLNKA